MTHFDSFLAMLHEASISHSIEERETVPEGGRRVVVQNSRGQGYTGFVSDWAFDGEGKLVHVGHYE